MWKFLEHTADIYVEISGKTVSDLFLNATSCFSQLLAPKHLLEASRDDWSTEWTFEGESYEELLMSWLKEMLYLNETEGKVVTSAVFHSLLPKQVSATVRGKVMDSEEWLDEADAEIKAVTYHNFRIEEGPIGLKAWVVFDI
jgi:SHS2 domain-containing protein